MAALALRSRETPKISRVHIDQYGTLLPHHPQILNKLFGEHHFTHAIHPE